MKISGAKIGRCLLRDKHKLNKDWSGGTARHLFGPLSQHMINRFRAKQSRNMNHVSRHYLKMSHYMYVPTTTKIDLKFLDATIYVEKPPPQHCLSDTTR
jgi:hypothetical protein